MKKETLLQKAINSGKKRNRANYDDEHIELAFAWLKDEVGLKQVNNVIGSGGKNTGNALYKIAMILKGAFRNKKITLNK